MRKSITRIKIAVTLVITTCLLLSCTRKPNNEEAPVVDSTAVVTVDTVEINETVTDIDDNVYRTVKIGNQIWMAENLKVTHYRNGDPIPNVTDNDEWANLSSGGYCNYENDAAYGRKYGKLYNWYAVDDYRGLAPAGWHVATDEEWTTLTNYLGGEAVAGGKLKSKTGWKQPNEGATNESGFGALSGGDRYRLRDESESCVFQNINNGAAWWTATEFNNGPWYRGLSNDNCSINRYWPDGSNGFAIRCIKDEMKSTPTPTSTTNTTSNNSSSSQILPSHLLGGTWFADGCGDDVRVRFIDNENLEINLFGSGWDKCQYRLQSGYPTGTISFEYSNSYIKLTYNTQFQTLYRVNGINDYVNYTKR